MRQAGYAKEQTVQSAKNMSGILETGFGLQITSAYRLTENIIYALS